MKKDYKEILRQGSIERKLIEILPYPRIWDYSNRVTEMWLRKIGRGKYKGSYSLEFLNKVGLDLTLKDLGYNDNWSTQTEHYEQNMNLVVTEKQLLELGKELLKRFGKTLLGGSQ